MILLFFVLPFFRLFYYQIFSAKIFFNTFFKWNIILSKGTVNLCNIFGHFFLNTTIFHACNLYWNTCNNKTKTSTKNNKNRSNNLNIAKKNYVEGPFVFHKPLINIFSITIKFVLIILKKEKKTFARLLNRSKSFLIKHMPINPSFKLNFENFINFHTYHRSYLND